MPGLMPFIIGEIEFAIINEGLGGGLELTSETVKDQYLLRMADQRFFFEQAAFVS